ncbi:MAG TPA: class I SAM-dependent methyltransferase [Gemmatimonadales bacterium]|nr:class I SAM-dependent methyltransferase [Gemmatimonadales bacterium]
MSAALGSAAAPAPSAPSGTPASGCRACGATALHTVLDLGMSPPRHRYLRREQLQQAEPFYPLQLGVCSACYLVQLVQSDGGSDDGANEKPRLTPSSARVTHARKFTAKTIEELRLTPRHQVLQIESHDGYLLQHYVAAGIPVLGIEPELAAARAAGNRGVRSRIELFTTRTARALRDEGIQADLLIARTLAQARDLNDVVAGMKLLLAPRGVVTIECPHLLRLVVDRQLDMIAHERVSYFSLVALTQILARHGLAIYDADELDAEDGWLRLFACHSEDPLRPITPRVDSCLAREREAGFDAVENYAGLAEPVHDAKRKLLSFLISAKDNGKRIAGYGASGRANVLLNYCGIRADFLDYTVDDDPERQGTYLPGTHIPVESPDRLRQTSPDYVLILPGTQHRAVLPQLESIRAWGGQCVVPLPEVRVVT